MFCVVLIVLGTVIMLVVALMVWVLGAGGGGYCGAAQ